jgi:hypothetical protein
LSRLGCFVSRPWKKAAAKIPDARLKSLVLDLVERRCPAVPGSDPDSWFYIDHALLSGLSAGAQGSDDDLLQLWIAVMIWGRASDNRGPAAVARALGSPKADVVKRLRASMAAVYGGNLVSAYQLCATGTGYLPGIGPSFFTKWLWAVGLAAGQSPLPLIFDSRVDGVGRSLGPEWTYKGGNMAERYADYCQLAADVAAYLTPQIGHVDAEKIEYALYCLA